MLEDPTYTKDYISWISSLYFSFYAFGQLINGLVGERIPAKWMICIGLLGAGVTNFVFSTVTLIPAAAMIAYGFTGLFLSMIYGPMTKVVAENTEPIYATRCSLGYTFASFFGSPVAGLLALFLSWRGVFNVSSIAMLAMSALCFLGFTAFERKKIIQYGKYKPKEKVAGNVKVGCEYLVNAECSCFFCNDSARLISIFGFECCRPGCGNGKNRSSCAADAVKSFTRKYNGNAEP